MKNKITTHLTRAGILVFWVSLLSIACVSIVGSVEAGRMMSALKQTAPGNQRTAPATQIAPAEKTVEQVQKNISGAYGFAGVATDSGDELHRLFVGG